tara:strand:- start:1480 stop:2721 length:1242 start_codon:yes stop_codon:yes gene_type:complete
MHIAAGVVNIHQAAIYLPALNFVAEEMANEKGHILGIPAHYSTLIAFVWAVTGHVQGFASPFVGTIIDFTRYRRLAGWIMAMCCSASLAAGGFIIPGNPTAFVAQLVNVCLAFSFYEGMYLVRISYLPECSPDVNVVAQLSSQAYALMYLTQIIYACIMLGAALAIGYDGVTTCRISAACATVLCAVLFSVAFALLRSRAAAQSIPPQWWSAKEAKRLQDESECSAQREAAAAADGAREAEGEETEEAADGAVPRGPAEMGAEDGALAVHIAVHIATEEETAAAEEETSPAPAAPDTPTCKDDPKLCSVCKWGCLHTLNTAQMLWKSFPCVGVFLIGYMLVAPSVSSLLLQVSVWFVSKVRELCCCYVCIVQWIPFPVYALYTFYMRCTYYRLIATNMFPSQKTCVPVSSNTA